MAENVLKRSRLKAAAKELNKKVGPGLSDDEEPYEGMTVSGIDLDAKSAALKKIITEVGKNLVNPDEDDLSDETWEVLEALGACERPKEEATEEEETDNDEEDVEEEEETDDDEEEATEEEEEEEQPEASLAEIVEGTKKLADLKELVEEHGEFKKLRKKLKNYTGLQGPKQLKADMFKALGVEAPAKSTSTKPSSSPKKPKGKTKKSVVEEMINQKKGATIEEIAQKICDEGIDEDYEKNCKVAKLWLQKMGFNTKKAAIEKNPKFKKAK